MEKSKLKVRVKEKVVLPEDFVDTIGHKCCSDGVQIAAINSADFRRTVTVVSEIQHKSVSEVKKEISKYYR